MSDDERVIVTVSLDGSPAVRVDAETRRLAADLRAAGRIAARPVDGADAPSGTKAGVAQQLGVIALSGVFSAATVKIVGDVLREFVKRTTAGSVSLRRGEREVTVSGVSPKDVDQLLAELREILSDEDES